MKVSRVALSRGDRRADESTDPRVVSGESGDPESRLERRRLRLWGFRTMESSDQRSGPGHGAPRSRGLSNGLRIQRLVVRRRLLVWYNLRRSGVHGGDDTDNCSDEGHHPGGQDHNDELQFGGGNDRELEMKR